MYKDIKKIYTKRQKGDGHKDILGEGTYMEEKAYPKQNERNVGGQRSSNHKTFVTAVKYVGFYSRTMI